MGDVINRVPSLATRAAYAKLAIRDKLIDRNEYMPAMVTYARDYGLAVGPGGRLRGSAFNRGG